MPPVGVYSETTLCRGRHGVLPDLWWGPSAANNNDTFPASLPAQFVEVGNVIVQSDGTVWQMS